nr:hypothetical protein [uncultured Sphingomonas sp.]
MFCVFRALIFVELAENGADEITGRPLPYILGDRHQLDLGLGQLTPIAFELELIAEEAAETMDNDKIKRMIARGRGLDHRLKLRPIIVRRRGTGFAKHILQQDAATVAIGRDRCDLVGEACLMLCLPTGRHPNIGRGTRRGGNGFDTGCGDN